MTMEMPLGFGSGGQEIDVAALRALVRGPGIDPRQWLSYGQVDADSPDAHSVRFNDDQGTPLPQGVLVSVTLQPSGIPVVCRVMGQNAGSGEGEYSPYGPGDEVLVAVPEGNERAGCVILGRLSNLHDAFPAAVAGMDVTQNNVTFRRMKTPYVFETAASYLVRSALNGASFSIDATGAVILNDGEGSMLGLNQSVITLQNKDGSVAVQLDPEALTVALQADSTSFVVDPNASKFLTTGTLAIGTSGMPASGHAVTLEQVINMFVNFVYFLNTNSPKVASDFVTGILLPTSFPVPFVAALQSWLLACVSPIPPTPVLGGGNLTAMGLAPIVTSMLTSQLPDPAALGVPTFMPGIGRTGLTF